MEKEYVKIGNFRMPVYSLNTVIVGTGAAGLNSADRLYAYGMHDCAIVTERVRGGTSRNTGSDKQTYYKLSLSGQTLDSVYLMAQTLFSGGCTDGDLALCEAALSPQCFLRLVELGVPFPRTRYGEFVGYKTDNDPYCRATSVGPYTSKIMTECLEASVKLKGIPVFDRHQVIKILKTEDGVCGLLCFSLEDADCPYVLFNCKNVMYATGGPAGIYSESVYPAVQFGSSGIAFEAGAYGKNLTEWQYGLASIRPRWNVSGTFMQVLPRFVSTDMQGNDKREFLTEYFQTESDMLTKIFLKGYQWPFDVQKDSSLIDILVYWEKEKGRRVFLDYQTNPGGKGIDFSLLGREALEYLRQAGACFGTPYERLVHMNQPAAMFFADHGVDVSKDLLEITLSAQHNNGGLAVDCWWQTNLPGFFAVGEVAGTHGVHRPGGSALNAGQVGSLRAAQYIFACRTGNALSLDQFLNAVGSQVASMIEFGEKTVVADQPENVRTLLRKSSNLMSLYGGPFRNQLNISKLIAEIKEQLDSFFEIVHISTPRDLGWVFRLRDIFLCQYVYLSAMEDYIRHGGKSRGSALYTDSNGVKPHPRLPDTFCSSYDDGTLDSEIQEVMYDAGQCRFFWREVRPIPQDDGFFENVWRTYRENRNIW